MIRPLFIAIIVISILSPEVIALDRFIITAYDDSENLAQDAYVEIWDAGDKIDSGYTNEEGEYESWLDTNTKYRITVRRNEQLGEWNGIPDLANRNIEIYMSVPEG